MSKTAKKRKRKTHILTLAHRAFVANITNKDSRLLYNNPVESYKAAYPRACQRTAQSNSGKLLHQTHIIAAIEQRMKRNERMKGVDSDYIKGEHLDLLAESKLKGDLVVATRNVELLGKTVGAYIDRTVETLAYVGQRPGDAIKTSEAKRKAFEAAREA